MKTTLNLLFLMIGASLCFTAAEKDMLNISCTPEQTKCYYGCCPYSNATCCYDGYHCCPKGETCLSWIGICYDLENKNVGKSMKVKDISRESFVLDQNNSSKYSEGNGLNENNKFESIQETQNNETCLHNMTHCGMACCPLMNATCCLDDLHCCPNGYKCDLESQSCKKVVEISSLKEHRTFCPTGMTECNFSCCPLPEAVCCSDGFHCCPKNYTCDIQWGRHCKKNKVHFVKQDIET